MSGRKHHYIPRVFLENFVTAEKRTHVWRISVGAAPHMVAITDMAAERDFYGSPDEDGRALTDDLITDYERTLTAFVQSFGSISVGDRIDPDEVGRLLSHLIIRPRHVRTLVSDFTTRLPQLLTELLTDGKALRAMLFQSDGRLHDTIEAEFRERLSREKVPQRLNLPINTIMRIARYFCRENEDGVVATASARLPDFVGLFGAAAPDASVQTHTRVLQEEMSPMKRREVLAQLDWEVLAIPDYGAVLPDCVALSRDKNGIWNSALLSGATEAQAIIFPVTHNRILLGRRDSNFVWNYDDYVQNAFRQSAEFAIASSLGDKISVYLPELGQGHRGHIESTLTSAFEDAKRKHTPQQAGIEVTNSDTSEKAQIGVHVAVGRSLSDDEIHKLQSNLSWIMNSLPCRDGLDALHGIIFADDIKSACMKISEECGTAAVSFEDIPDDQLLYAIQPVRIGDERKLNIVFQDSLSVDIASDDQAALAGAMETVCSALSSMLLGHFRENHELATERHVEQPLRDQIATWGFPVFFYYFEARQRSRVLVYDVDKQINILESLMQEATDEVGRLIGDHLEGESVDSFFIPAIQYASAIGSKAAWLAGLIEESAEPDILEPRLSQLCAQYGLAGWFELLRGDLLKQYEQLPLVRAPANDPLLDHFDRLLLAFGIVVTIMPDKNVWVQPFLPTSR
jgi:hypothetical protein